MPGLRQQVAIGLRRGSPTCAYAACILVGSLLSGLSIAGTDPISVHGDMDIEAEAPKPEKPVDWFVVPIPTSNPTLGTGLEAVGMLLYKVDDKSPDSFTALGGGYTSNHSWFAGLAEKLYLDSDRFRVMGGGGYGNVNYNFFGIGDSQANAGASIPITQKVTGAFIDARMRIWNSTYLGLRYVYADVRTDLPIVTPPSFPYQIPTVLDLRTQAIGVVANYDTRDRQFSPHAGTYVDFKSSFSVDVQGNRSNYQTYALAYNHYQAIGSEGVLAERVSLCDASRSAPFFDLCIFGTNSDLRGYEAGRYRDHFMATGQVEYRQSFTARFGAVAFAGAGAVAADFQALFSSTLLPSGGLGLRYVVAPSQGVTLSADYAWGKGSQGLYVYVGDAF
jgi:hypothetical protein